MFITFEGIEGSGKSTQCRRLKARLEQVSRQSVLLTREPGASSQGRHLRAILLDLEILQQVNDFAVQGLRPDCTVLIDLPAEIGLARAMTRNQESPQSAAESRFEAEALDFHRRVRRGFLELAARTPERFCTLDGAQAPDQVFHELWAKLGAALPGLSGLNAPPAPEALA